MTRAGRSRSWTAALVAATLLLGACGAPTEDDPAGDAAEVPVPAPPPDPDEANDDGDARDDEGERDQAEPSADPPPPPPPPDAYGLHEAEIARDVKRAAVDLVERLTTYDPDDHPDAVVAHAADGDDDLARHLGAAAAPLLHEGSWSRGTVVYPQLGGLEPREASVMVVVDLEVGHPDGEVTEQRRVLDVRARRSRAGDWHVVELASAGGDPVPRPDDLSPAEEAVLDHPDIELPDTARWDVHRGIVDQDLLEVMARMADRTPYGVVVFDTGHPRNVFGTERPSKHSEGRAVDVYRLDGPPVIERRSDGTEVHGLVEWLYDQPEIAEIGSPWALDERGGRSFTDQLHQDHIHIGAYRNAR